MLWKILQYLIFAAIVVSNGVYHWTPNGYLAGLEGIACAFLFTVAANKGLELASRAFKRPRPVLREQSADKGVSGRS